MSRTESDISPWTRRLRLALRALLVLVAAAVLLVFLFTWLFPRVERRLENPTIGNHQSLPAIPGADGATA